MTPAANCFKLIAATVGAFAAAPLAFAGTGALARFAAAVGFLTGAAGFFAAPIWAALAIGEFPPFPGSIRQIWAARDNGFLSQYDEGR